jgi:hypothetical protein
MEDVETWETRTQRSSVSLTVEYSSVSMRVCVCVCRGTTGVKVCLSPSSLAQ